MHLGLGRFFLAHQAWYTHGAPDAGEWGYATFGGRGSARSSGLAASLTEQGGSYTLVERGRETDHHQVIDSVVAAHDAADVARWHRYLTDPGVTVVTTTVTEAGYAVGPSGGADLDDPSLRNDIDLLRGSLLRGGSAGLTTAPVTALVRLVAGLAARRRADAGPITLVPCDNLPANGAVLSRVVLEVAMAVDPTLAGWIDASVSVVSTVVDRITPRTTEADVVAFTAATGVEDRCLVVTEAFSEWILSGRFAAGHPDWSGAGARFVEEVEPFERRKLWLLNGAHSLLAYAGSIRGHRTVAEAMSDDVVAGWVEEWWTEASGNLDLPADDLADYRATLVERFTNRRIAHRLAQIAADGSQKIPIRIVPTLRAERNAGRPGTGAARVVAAWLCHLRGKGALVNDPGARGLTELVEGSLEHAAAGLIAHLDPDLAGDTVAVETVLEFATELERWPDR